MIKIIYIVLRFQGRKACLKVLSSSWFQLPEKLREDKQQSKVNQASRKIEKMKQADCGNTVSTIKVVYIIYIYETGQSGLQVCLYRSMARLNLTTPSVCRLEQPRNVAQLWLPAILIL